MAELLIGCGNSRHKFVANVAGNIYPVPLLAAWTNLVTLDIDPSCGADHEWDLARLPLPFPAETFQEIHAYNVLEHVGNQGDWRFFFAQFTDFWRMLKPDGLFCGALPKRESCWVWGDPGHTRYLGPETLSFLQQPAYASIGKTTMTDYRHWYEADFELWEPVYTEHEMYFVLRAIKPARLV